VDAIHKLSSGFSKFSSIICNIRNTFNRNPNFVVKFIKWQTNLVTHTLAKVAVSWASHCICETLPLCISSLLHNEMIWVCVCQFFFLSFYIYMNQMVKLYIIDILISILICIHLTISKTDFSNLKILPRVHTFIQSHSFRNSILISNGHHQKDEHLC
jgi:hypothetical protein